ncbi:unnamed protein product [Mytilus edulis]|uniref:Fucolectin tachylectin-4 pentraxin-1 domain-containing protein n=1 Tax=Mytilus edulis TaxID=6550 RepID=A0A8S3TPE8_MYTED|nr:unnamed protein product [Mytilus edulis]
MKNIALNKDTMQSSYFIPSMGSSQANDGNREQNELAIQSFICSHTLEDQTDYWWAVDLGQEFNINTIAIYNRIDCCALNKDTMQSSYFIPSMGSSQANDGNREQNELTIQSFICSHTLEDQTDYWWAVDLGQEFNINTIAIYNRIDCCGFYRKQLNKQPMMRVQTNLTNFTNVRCAISCRNIDSCLGFTMTLDGTCSLFQTSKYLPSDSSDSGSSDNEYFEKC